MFYNSRKCKLPEEIDGFEILKEYTRKGCEIECAVKRAQEFCHCKPWQYPNKDNYPICDMFGGYCFDTIMSDEVHYKKCQFECLEDCEEIGKISQFYNILTLCTHTNI